MAAFPLCFVSAAAFALYRVDARLTKATATSHCEDCTPAYQARMEAEQRCGKARAEAEAFADAVDARLAANTKLLHLLQQRKWMSNPANREKKRADDRRRYARQKEQRA